MKRVLQMSTVAALGVGVLTTPAQELSARLGEYDQAYGTCLRGRGYTVSSS